MEPPPYQRPAARRLAAACAPFAWLAVALVGASLFALALRLALPAGPDPGEWNPLWSYAELHLEGLDAPSMDGLTAEVGARFPDRRAEWREAEDGLWLSLAGAGQPGELLADLRAVVGERGGTSGRIAFGSNLGRIMARVFADPASVVDAASALLPLTLTGGSLVLLVLGLLLRRRLRRDSDVRERPTGSRPLSPRSLLAGVGLGVLLALTVEGVGALMAALGRPIVEQPWIAPLFEQGGPVLYATLPLIVLMAPLAEEVFFRGYMLAALRRAWGLAGSVVLSSAAFAFIHGHGPALPAYFVYGVGLALAAHRTGGLAVPITAHVTVNAIAVSYTAWVTAWGGA